jgi:hypothetical protein
MNYKYSNGFIDAVKPTKYHQFFHSYQSSKFGVTLDVLSRIQDDIEIERIEAPKEVRIVQVLTQNNCYCDVWLL